MKEYHRIDFEKGKLKEAYLKSLGLAEENLEVASEPYFENESMFQSRILHWKEVGYKVAIIGDYDVDGVTASTIMSRILGNNGIDYITILPNRFVDGYGLKPSLVDKAIAEGCQAIVTVDNGIAAVDAVDYAKKKGLAVLVTDHHVPGEILPHCHVFNPQCETGIFFKSICGAEVVYFLAKRTRLLSGQSLDEARQLATVALVADVMPVLDVNRQLLKQLIDDAKKDRIVNKGLKALIAKSGSPETFNEETLGFQICPMLNAAGRIRTAMSAYRLLNETDDSKVVERLERLNAFNQIRKDLTMTAVTSSDRVCNDNVIVNVMKTDDEVNEGLVGIVAGRYCEKESKPSFVFTKTATGTYKGSGRSILTYNLIQGAKRVFSAHPEFGNMYGGHTGAMGLTLPNLAAVTTFGNELSKDVVNQGTKSVLQDYFDLDEAKISLEEAYEELDGVGPFGEGLPRPLFSMRGTVCGIRPLGKGTSFAISKGGEFINFNHFNEATEVGNHRVFFEICQDIYKGTVRYKGNVSDML